MFYNKNGQTYIDFGDEDLNLPEIRDQKHAFALCQDNSLVIFGPILRVFLLDST